MKVILKPAGLLVVLASFGLLAFIALPKKAPEVSGGAVPVSGKAPASTSTVGAGVDSSLATAAPSTKVDWSKAKRILEPDITGKNWRELSGKGKMALTVVPANVKGHPFARHIVVSEPGANAWDLQIAHSLEVAFAKGHRVRLSFWARSKSANSMLAVVEQAGEPYTKLATKTVSLTPQWQQFFEEWQQVENTSSGWAHVDFQFGQQAGELEITGVVLDAVKE